MILAYIAAAWLAGAAAGALGYATWWPMVALGCAGLAVGWVRQGRPGRAVLLVLVLVAGLVSLARYEAATSSTYAGGGVASYNEGEPVRIIGTVSSEPEERLTTQRFVVDVAAVEVDGVFQPLEGRVLVTRRLFPRHSYGEIVDMTAALETPPIFDRFDYREYLARRGITSTASFPSIKVLGSKGGNGVKRALIETRRPFGEALERVLPEPEAALARGILLGQRASIPEEVNEAFNAAGISHLIAISGYNVMLVAGAVIATLAPLTGRRQATVVALVVVGFYAVFVGGDPPVLRAALMALVMLGATLSGRPGSALTGVGLAGAVLVAWRPLIIEDVSFQLSFAATLGLVVGAPPLRDRLLVVIGPRLPPRATAFVSEQVAVTTAASIAVVPIIAASFGRLSLVSLPANVLAAPAFVFALLGAFVTALAGAIDTSAGRVIGELAYLPLRYLVMLAEVASSLPLASVSISSFGLPHVMAAYAGIGAVAAALSRYRNAVERTAVVNLRPAPALALVSLFAAGFLWWGALQPHEPHLRVSILDVGQGDSIFIESPAGTRVLIDGGASGALISQALGAVLPPAEHRIDLMVLTHAQDDHVTGLVEVLERFDVGAVLWNGEAGDTGAYRAWASAVERRNLPVAVVEAGQLIDLGGGAHMEVLHPQPLRLEGTEDDLNNNSIVLRLVFGNVSFLLTGDIEADGEAAILHAGQSVSATVLKVAHHGSDGATTYPFLDAVGPSIAVISAGSANAFGHPSPTLQLRLAGVPLLRTDLNGTVQFETDGRRLWLDYERGDVSLLDQALVP